MPHVDHLIEIDYFHVTWVKAFDSRPLKISNTDWPLK
jgi:hypothetical protein